MKLGWHCVEWRQKKTWSNLNLFMFCPNSLPDSAPVFITFVKTSRFCNLYFLRFVLIIWGNMQIRSIFDSILFKGQSLRLWTQLLSTSADMIFVKCFTPAQFPKYWNLPEKKRVNRDISDSYYGVLAFLFI